MAYIDPETAADAHRLKLRAKMHRASAKEWESMGSPNNVTFNLWEAAGAEEAADKFLTLSEAPIAGAGGELIPTGDNANGLRGVVDTAKNADRVTTSASGTRIALADEAGVYDLAVDMAETIQAKNSIEKALAHQMGAAHSLAMHLVTEVNRHEYPADRVRLANAAAKMMSVFQDGALTLLKLRGGGQQQVTVVHQHVQVAGGQVAVTGTMNGKVGNDRKQHNQGAMGGETESRDQPHAP